MVGLVGHCAEYVFPVRLGLLLWVVSLYLKSVSRCVVPYSDNKFLVEIKVSSTLWEFHIYGKSA